MKANSNNHPGEYTKSKGKLFFNFNITESQKTDEHGTRTNFDYEYVEVDSKDKDSIIKAIMRDGYTIDDEIAMINNKFKAGAKEDLEYDSYQAFRAAVKLIAESAI